MKEIIILGAGMIGRAIAIDLAKRHKVTSCDRDAGALALLKDQTYIRRMILNVSDRKALYSAIQNFDLVISAVPGFLGFNTVKHAIESGKNTVDISFMPEDPVELDVLAKKNNVTVINDCGVAPGLPNYIIGFYNERMKIESFDCMVGGLPKVRVFPFEYKASFSPTDVIEEYLRPARFIENGKVVMKPSMSDAEYIDFEKAGTLEAFNTDGLRSLVRTMSHIPHIKEKTLRYPGHIKLIQALMSAGFFKKDILHIDGFPVVPFDVTSRILFDSWKSDPHEPEFTILKVVLQGVNTDKKRLITYQLYDEYDPVEKLSSMARTTGFTVGATAELILSGKFNEKGVFPPELVGKYNECFEFLMNYLAERNIRFEVKEEM